MVVQTGSVTLAARMLGYAPSTVSGHVARLETHLGVQLLRRGPDGMRPTAVAQQVLPHAERIMLHHRRIQQIANQAASTGEPFRPRGHGDAVISPAPTEQADRAP